MRRPLALAGLTLPLAALFTLPAAAAERAKQPDAAPPQLRPSVQRGLAFLEKEGLAWLRERKCVACHHGPFLLWSENEARRRGLAPDAKKLDDHARQVLDLYLADQKQYRAKKSGYVEATNLLLAHTAFPRGATADRARTLASLVAGGQRTDGSWKYAGQPQKRPDREADETTTSWATLALASAADSAAARGRALAWLKANRTGQGNEAAALRLLVEVRFGDAGRARALADELTARQNADGGWSWAKGLPSDPFATGQSLYALARAGRKGDDPAVGKARAYLLRTQRPDGSWFAATKKPTGKNHVISSYWGTAWATIGLLQLLPEEAPPAPKPAVARMVYYTGRVQGVSFRATTAALARDYPVTGWVKNLRDGRVQLLAEGPEEGVARFLQAVRARWKDNITKEQAQKQPVRGTFPTFEVVR